MPLSEIQKGLVAVATQGGLNFAAFSVFVSAGFLMVVAVALFCGDTVATEASWSSLRYLLAAPVPRVSLLFGKYLAVFTVAVLTALVNLASMTLSLLVSARLFSGFAERVLGPEGIRPVTLPFSLGWIG